ncbi:MAG: LysR substrate-binding domain-containing protein [Chloroflexota bacterium]|nr:LysR family transcriptional regulator [Chloroflexota bacterium]
MSYTLHRLKVFCAVASTGSYTQAARQLGIQQPTVSEQVKTLEKSFDLDLIERINGNIRLTDAGRELYIHIQHVIGLAEDLEHIVEQLRDQNIGTVKVCADTTVGTSVMPRVISDFRLNYPEVHIILEVVNRSKVIERLEEGSVDLAVMGRPPDIAGLEVEDFLSNDLVIIASIRHRLANCDHLPLSELAEERFLVRENGSGTRMALIELLESAGLRLRVAMVLGHNEAIKNGVMADLGIALMSRWALEQEIKLHRLVELKVEGLPITRRWHIVFPSGKLISPATRHFKHFLENFQS